MARNRNKVFDFKFNQQSEQELLMTFNVHEDEVIQLKTLTADYENTNAARKIPATEDDSLLYNGYLLKELQNTAKYNKLIVAFRYSTEFSPSTEDTPDPVKTSTGAIQPGTDDETVTMEFEGVVFPESYLHDILQQWALNYGSTTGFDEAILRGFVRNTQTGTAKYSENQWKFLGGTVKADDSWSPDDKLTRSFSLKATSMEKVVNGAKIQSSLEKTLNDLKPGAEGGYDRTDKDIRE